MSNFDEQKDKTVVNAEAQFSKYPLISPGHIQNVICRWPLKDNTVKSIQQLFCMQGPSWSNL